MSEETRLRDEIALLAKSLYDRGLTHGSTGNISARLSDGSLLVTPTGSSLGMLDPARISRLDGSFKHIDGDLPTKEVPLHSAFYETRQAQTGAVVHLHSTHSVALSVLPETDPDNVLPPITPYSLMQLGKVKLLPYFMPGDAAMGEAVRGLAGKHSAVLLANHGPVVAAKNLRAAVFAMEELEATARLVLLTRGMKANLLTDNDVAALAKQYPVE
ncbi:MULTISPECIES: 3-oxo-tetronate 4-phosphate decarboxylase [unclassified Nitratireductor]|uniref:3-oxo-tetronate 4-phosphate decarboxylase n=1 Tax=unclassified Nitratireductor TaxID=2641084 RepID=UPI0025DD8D73|nr:3-oxo-tetronate 4-phosphate decarboxylase [Nitratireductor sp.]